MKHLYIIFVIYLASISVSAQTLKGKVLINNNPAEFINVQLKDSKMGTLSDSTGKFTLNNLPAGKQILIFSGVGYKKTYRTINVLANKEIKLSFEVEPDNTSLKEVVVTGTMKETSINLSPVPVEIYNPTFFRKNPTPNLFDALSMVNGVRPQLNCNVCNTGDIHINGMEGAYTMVTIDGMPIVSALSTVYGLSGIPNSMIERIEVVKGPASTLYGSEAVGGLINVITKNPLKAPLLSFDYNATSYGEHSVDGSVKAKIGSAITMLSVNYFNFQNRIDKNDDAFTDVTLQNRISLFNKWSFQRKEGRAFNVALRYVFEDRFGGELNWKSENRGGNDLYGESIFTKRWEVIGNYQLPINKEKVTFQLSYNNHDQNSAYGNSFYLAKQEIAFGQMLWDKKIGKNHDALFGLALRYTHYDDNTLVTRDAVDSTINRPSNVLLPGIFAQDEITVNSKNKILVGLRYDYNSVHGNIFSPRLNWKYSSLKNDIFRFSVGNGYRVVNLFSEDHAAYSGARKVEVKSELNPERSWNTNLNYQKIVTHNKGFIQFDGSIFYTHFSNKIVADYDTDPNKVIFDNLKGYGELKGASLNTDFSFTNGLKLIVGGTYTDIYRIEDGVKIRQKQTPIFTANYAISYTHPKTQICFDLTGLVYGSMDLPLIEDDIRPATSPVFGLTNIQISKRFNNGLQFYVGIKNLFDYLPDQKISYRANQLSPNQIKDSAYGNLPKGYYFNSDYNYAPMQGIRAFAGLRWNLY